MVKYSVKVREEKTWVAQRDCVVVSLERAKFRVSLDRVGDVTQSSDECCVVVAGAIIVRTTGTRLLEVVGEDTRE